jgi:hypothetical protein
MRNGALKYQLTSLADEDALKAFTVLSETLWRGGRGDMWRLQTMFVRINDSS